MTARQLVNESQFFSVTENWGDLDKINPLLITFLCSLRSFLNAPVRINCAYATKGHTSNSQHYVGNACDFAILKLPFVEAINKVKLWCLNEINVNGQFMLIDNYIGLGIYPFWNTPGFHLDVRGHKARWAYNGDNKQISFESGYTIACGMGK